MTALDDVQQDRLYREGILRRLRFISLKHFEPVGGIGTLATFEVAIAGLLKIRACRLHRREGQPLRLVTSRVEGIGGFAVELQPWLRNAITEGAINVMRRKLEPQLAAVNRTDTATDGDTSGVRRFVGAEVEKVACAR